MVATTQLMSQVKEGMPVYDSEGKHIGSVDSLHYGQIEAATTKGEHNQRDESLIENLAEALAPSENMPDELRARLLRHGFIRIDSGILSSDVYVVPENLARVDEHVHLSIKKDKLIKL